MPKTTGKHFEGEQVFRGMKASKGLVKGEVFIYKHHEFTPEGDYIQASEVEYEISRLKDALARSKKELLKIERVTQQKLGEVFSEIFSAQIMMLNDHIMLDRVF